jgi:hypothetical protein
MPLIPRDVANQIAGGENALRELRKWRGETRLYTACETSIGHRYISEPDAEKEQLQL